VPGCLAPRIRVGVTTRPRTAADPRTAKTLGRGVAGFDERTWADERFEIVVAAGRARFGQHADLPDWLIGTGDRILVEIGPTDRVRGIGLAAGDDRAVDPGRWRGRNLLGFALMRARATLAAGPTAGHARPSAVAE
jgi:ribA/ribD-fused uncharacterized protein